MDDIVQKSTSIPQWGELDSPLFVFYYLLLLIVVLHPWVISMPKKRNVYYGTIQVREFIKKQIVEYCDRQGLKISRFVEKACISAISGSNSYNIV